MKNTRTFLVGVALVAACFLCLRCEKDGGVGGCETVTAGDQFLKVVNKSGGKINVDMTNVIPLQAEVRNGACELYGLPEGSHEVTIENLEGAGSRDVSFSLGDKETFEVVVDGDFF